MSKSAISPSRPKGGAPPGNLNAVKSGATLRRLALGELPAQLIRVTRYCRAYRRELEAAVVAVHGEIDLVHAHVIDAACGHEQHGAVCRWLLRQRIDTMATADIRECSRAISAAKDARNRALKELGLSRNTQADIVATLYTYEDDDEEPRKRKSQ